MKFRNIIPALLASVALCFVGCSDDETPTLLDEVQVSSSYVTIPLAGGSTKIVVTATEDWTMDFDVPVATDSLDDVKGIVKYYENTNQLNVKDNTWFKVSQTSGGSGKTEITFTADATEGSRSVDIRIKAGDKYQHLVVAQVFEGTLPVSTIKEVLGGVDNKTYRVKGQVSAIENTSYGNFKMKDAEGNILYIYGTVDATGAYNWSKFNIALGDEVTVEGPRLTYKGVIELVDAAFISVKKSLIASDESEKTINKEAETFTIALTQKGNVFNFNSDVDWLTIAPRYTIDSNGNYVFKVTATANPNTDKRIGTIVFTSTLDSISSELPITVTQLGSLPVNGTVADIAAITATSTNSNTLANFNIILKDAKVTYKNGDNTYLEDATGGILLYKAGSELKVGQTINGQVWGAGYAYSGLAQITQLGLGFATVSKESNVVPTEVTMAELAANYNKYISRYIHIKDATVGTDIDVVYSKVRSAGTITDGTNSFKLSHQRTGVYNKSNIFYYLHVAAESKVGVTCIPKTGKTLNVYSQSWITQK